MSAMTPRDATWRASGGGSPPRVRRAMPGEAPTAREGVRDTPWSRLEVASASSRGGVHRVNEDAHSEPGGDGALFVVADGVGGGAHAARASRELVDRLHDALDRVPAEADTVRLALLAADRAIGRSLAERGRATGAATVVLCRALDRSRSRWLVAWVGDCRAYRLDGAKAELLTVDDTYRNRGESPPPGGSPDDPARMVGNGAVDRPNVRCVALRPGELIALASDGVHKHAGPGDFARLANAEGTLAARCRELVERARAAGSRDDATVLVVRRLRPSVAGSVRRIAAAVACVVAATALVWLAGGGA
jgi:protein phosphatase